MRLINSFLTTAAVTFSMTTAAFAASSDTSAEVGANVSAGNSSDVNANTTVKSDANADSKQASNNSDANASVNADGDTTGDEILVVTVDGEEITQADVFSMIAMLPKQVQQQPQERLVPMVVDQLIMRELILDAAKADLKGSQQVKAEMDKGNVSEEEAVVNVYLREKLNESVTDKEVKATYEEIKSNTDKELPPFEAVKAQIEKQLRYEAYASLREDLQSDVEIVFYGPDGKPQTASDS